MGKIKRTLLLWAPVFGIKEKLAVMRKRDGMVIVWPAYLDSNLSRAQGRKVPKNLGAPEVTIEILKKAAESAGFEYELEPDKRYPRNWSGASGYLVLGNSEGHKKKRLLLMLAKGVRRIVAQRDSAKQEAEKKKSKKKRKGKKK
ncbi:MAG: signal recognition particle subunit SRP19/SEC65 family protein [Candidatus Thorarchaeota archaeon]|jgi:signal recognition particle subunit SRP19